MNGAGMKCDLILLVFCGNSHRVGWRGIARRTKKPASTGVANSKDF